MKRLLSFVLYCVATPLVLVQTGCGEVARVALPAPFPLTYGGTPVPASGAGLSVEYGDALRGQELQRTEVVSAGLLVGLFDRVSGSFVRFRETGSDKPSGSLWRLAARAVSPFGRRSSTSVYGGLVSMSGTTLPREQLRVVDLAVPTEFLISQPPVHPWDTRFSVYLGPRVANEHYDDLDNPDQSLAATYYGLLGGLHLTAGFFHLFAEATLTHVPQNQYQGQTYGDRWTVMPAIGMVFHAGRAYSWK